MIEAIVLGSLALVFYTYAGYPAMLWLLTRGRAAPQTDLTHTPGVTVVIAAFNEEGCIGETISSILAADYPAERLNLIVVSDASMDRTDEVVRGFVSERVRLIRQPERSGQTAGLVRGAREARSELVILADASGRFYPHTVRRLVRHFIDPHIGAVSGYNGIGDSTTAVSKGDGLYARYDRLLRTLESRLGSSWVGCQGGLFAIRRDLFRVAFPLNMAADNAICYELYEQGFLHRFDPEAMVLEKPPQGLVDEFRRKIRIIVLQLHGVFYFRRLFNPLRHPQFFFQNFSHKVCRWLVPFALIAAWLASGLIQAAWARGLFLAQSVFYALALLGLLYGRRRKAPKLLSIPAYFVTVNSAGLLAWGLLFRNYTLWNPPSRELAPAKARN